MVKLALTYVFCQKEIDYILIGVEKISQLEQLLLELDGNIQSGFINEINNIHVKEVEMLYPKNWQ